MTKPSYDECLIEAELRARACYVEPGRRYHNQDHLDDCLQHLERVREITDGERQLLRWALLWHDAIYDSQKSDNEEQSAELARLELAACGVDGDTIAEVTRLILLTKGHKVPEDDRLGALMVSIDLAILGADPIRYEAYVRDVRREYAHVPDEAWRAGRSAVLQSLMADCIFADPEFRAELEDQARANMSNELRSLTAG